MKISDAEYPLSPELKEAAPKPELHSPKASGKDSPGSSSDGKSSSPINVTLIEEKTPVPEPPSPKDILKKLFPSYEDNLLNQALLQNDHNLVKTIQKLAPHTAPHPMHSSNKHPCSSSSAIKCTGNALQTYLANWNPTGKSSSDFISSSRRLSAFVRPQQSRLNSTS
ncbi:unnamed protein product, partial [Allacma fusca]